MNHADAERKEHYGRREAWHLSKEVPIALIGTMLATIVGVALGWSNLTARVDSTEKAIIRIETTAIVKENKLDSKLDQIQNDVTKIKEQFLLKAQDDLARERSLNESHRR